ncbi:MAG: SGNH/GDSL hydrolase family protein [Planctomycetes bacterium]|nr:SGNH/GDSL hydrolase family protein [Planctomycetota bacterium]
MRKLLLLGLTSLFVVLLAFEGLVRLRQWQRYGTTLPTYYRFVDDPESGLRIPEPLSSVGPIKINSLGFRGPELKRPKPPARVRVAFLGGSTTFCAEASSFAATWPELVLAGLRADAPELEFDAVNCGAGGFTTAESRINLERRVAPLQPDVIVYYEATNDLTRDARKAAIAVGLYEARERDHARLGDWWLTYFLVEKNLRQYLEARGGEEHKLNVEPRELSRGFEERLTELLTSAKQHALVVAIATFAVRMRPEQTAEVQRAAAASALFYMPFLDLPSLLADYAEYNRVIRGVAHALDVILIEGETSIPGDREHFADSVHLRDPGLRLQADRVLAGLLAAPAYRQLVEQRRALRAR